MSTVHCLNSDFQVEHDYECLSSLYVFWNGTRDDVGTARLMQVPFPCRLKHEVIWCVACLVHVGALVMIMMEGEVKKT